MVSSLRAEPSSRICSHGDVEGLGKWVQGKKGLGELVNTKLTEYRSYKLTSMASPALQEPYLAVHTPTITRWPANRKGFKPGIPRLGSEQDSQSGPLPWEHRSAEFSGAARERHVKLAQASQSGPLP